MNNSVMATASNVTTKIRRNKHHQTHLLLERCKANGRKWVFIHSFKGQAINYILQEFFVSMVGYEWRHNIAVFWKFQFEM